MGAAVTAVALGVGLGRSRAESGWVRPGAILDADFAAGRFSFAGRNHTSKAEFLAAVGGLEASGAVAIGPYDILTTPERVTNGDFSAGSTGWAAYSLGGSPLFTVTDGVAKVAGNGASNPGFVQQLALDKGHAYRWRGRARTVSQQGGLSVSRNANLTSSSAVLVSTPSPGGMIDLGCTFSAEEAATFVGTRQFSAASTGETEFDNISVTEVVPFKGFVPGGFAAIISGVLPATPSGGKVIVEWSGGEFNTSQYTEINYVRLLWDASCHLRLVIRAKNSEQANLDLGSVGPLASFEVIMSLRANEYRAALRGGPVQLHSSGELPGAARLFLKRQNDAGSTFDGVLSRVTLFASPWTEGEFLDRQADARSIAAWGDSLAAGAGGSAPDTSYPAVAASAFSPPISIARLGVGGQTSTQIAARQGGRPILVTLSGNQIPASGNVAVTAKNINVLYNSGLFQGSQRGWLSGVMGDMTTDASGNWTFLREVPGTAVVISPNTQFIPEMAIRMRRRTQWLWLGRNGSQSGYTLEGDIAAAVAWLGHDRFLIGSVLTSADDDAATIAAIISRNADLAATYGGRFVDAYAALRATHDGSTNDLADIAAGLIPRSLRSDPVHLNDTGYAVAAASFKAVNDARGW